MLDSPVFNAIIGLILTYALLTVFVSSIIEAISTALGTRAKNLRKGLQRLLDSPQVDGLVQELYKHPLINPMNQATPEKLPSYIDPKNFSKALYDLIFNENGGVDKLKSSKLLDDLPKDSPVKLFLLSLIDQVEVKSHSIQTELAHWFDTAMDRLSGEYKRSTQLWSFILAFGTALLLNIDTLHLSQVYWKTPTDQINILADKALNTNSTNNINPEPVKKAESTLNDLYKLPIGWQDKIIENDGALFNDWLEFTLFVIGCLISACSVLFGAPFWFDLLSSFVKIRGTGTKPNQK